MKYGILENNVFLRSQIKKPETIMFQAFDNTKYMIYLNAN